MAVVVAEGVVAEEEVVAASVVVEEAGTEAEAEDSAEVSRRSWRFKRH